MEDIGNIIGKAINVSPHGMVVLEGEKIKGINREGVTLLDGEKTEEIIGKEWRDFFVFEEEDDKNFTSTTGKIITLKGVEKKIAAFILSLEENGKKYRLIVFQEYNEVEKIRQHILVSISKRMSKLEAYYEISNLAKDSLSVDEFLHRVVRIIPRLMNHPELAFSKIVFRGKEYGSQEKMEGVIKEDILIDGRKEGYILAGYREKIPHPDSLPMEDDKRAIEEVVSHIADVISVKETKKEHENSMLYFQTILEKSSDITMVVDENAVVDFITPSIKEVLGYSPEEVVGKSALAFIHPDDMEKCAWQHKKLLENPSKSILAVYRVKAKDGKWRYARVKGRNMLHDPLIKGLILNFHDITDMVIMERKLEENEKKLRSLIDATHDLVLLASVSKDNFGEILEINDAMANSLGGKKEEIVGTNIREHLPPEVYESRTAKLQEMIRNGKPVEFEDRRRGRWFHNVFYPIFDGDGKIVQVAVFTRDITEEKMAREELEKNKIYFQTLLEKGWDVVMVHDENAVIKYVTPSVKNLSGYEVEEVIGRKSTEFVHPDDMDAALNSLRYMLENPGKLSYGILRVKHASGKWITVEIYARNLLDDPIVRGIVVNYRDITAQRKLERRIRESEARFREVVENASEWVWEVNAEGLYTYSNNAVKKILGYSPSEIVGKKHFYDFFHPDEREELKEASFKIFNEKKSFNRFLNRNIHRDGDERWLLTSGVPIMDEEGNLLGYRGVDTDITDIKKAEERIKELHQYLKAIIDNANIWINTLDREGNVIIWNRAAETISGYSMEEVVGHKKIWEWLYPDEDYRKRILRKAADIIEGRERVKDFETIIRTKDGQEKIISWYSKNIVVDGEIVGSVAVGMDVTEKRLMEREMRKFKRVADTAQYGVLIVDGKGKITYINEYFANLHGYKPEELVGKSLKVLVAEKSAGEIPRAKRRVIEKGYLEPTEVYHRRRDGSIFPLLVGCVLIREEDDFYFGLTYMDLSEKKKMEEMIKRKEKLAALGKLAAVVAHEINTPLANIAVTADYISSSSPDFREEMEIIKREVETASSIIRDILDFSRKEIKEMQEFDLRDAMEEAIEKISRIYPLDEILIQNRMNSCPFTGDRQRIVECFVNVLKNAVMARDAGKKTHYVIIESEEGKNIKVRVRDNGTGMDKSTLKNATKPFFSTRPIGEGTGLGLFITKWIVEAHGGKIEIRSRPGEGTEVIFMFPGGER